MSLTRGAFIVIEGLDRSGKSTQTARLVERLEREGCTVKLHKFPDRTTPTGKMIDSYLKSQSDLDDRVIHLLFSTNRWEAAEGISKELQSGITVVADRYAFSGIAFSIAKHLAIQSPNPTAENTGDLPPATSALNLQHPASTLTYEWCRAPDISLPSPDLVLFLSVEPDIQAKRGGFGEERYEKAEMQRRVREVFGRIADEQKNDARLGKTSLDWVDINAGESVERVGENIWKSVNTYVAGVNRPLGRLWNYD